MAQRPPASPTVPGARDGYNCRMSVSGYGSIYCRTVSITPALKIISSDQKAHRHRAFYPFITSGSSFSMTLVHASHAERETFNRWITTYLNKVLANESIGGTVLVEVPSRLFSRVAVPEEVVANYGETVGDISYQTDLTFKGAKEPLSAIGKDNVGGDSYIKAARNGNATSRYFYPTGTQVAGAAKADGVMFDRAAAPLPASAVPSMTDSANAVEHGLTPSGLGTGALYKIAAPAQGND